VMESAGFHPGRRGRDHLEIMAQVTGEPRGRVDAVLDQVGLAADADRRIGGYSLGMRQRLGLAAALLGDPAILVLDEPANGLDPKGMVWLRGLLRKLASEGRTILISSHVLSEVAQTVDRVVIISEGRLRFAGPLSDLAGRAVSVHTSEAGRLRVVLLERGYAVDATGDSTLEVRGATSEDVGRTAAEASIALTALRETETSLEAAFLRLTGADDTPTSAEAPAPAGMR